MNSQHKTQIPILWIFVGLALSQFLAALDSTIVSTALPTIVSEFNGLTQISWVVTAYMLAQTVVIPVYGKLGDLYGRARMMQVAIILFLIGSVLCGLSRTMNQLIIFRAIQGLGGGGLMVTAQAIIGDVIPPRDRGRYQGIFGAVFGLASVMGPFIGGYFTTQLSWRWIFYINLPLGAFALLLLTKTLPKMEKSIKRQIDYAGAILFALFLSLIIFIADLGGHLLPWDSPIIIGLGVSTIITLIVFVLVEHRAPEPVLPLTLFLNKTFATASFVGMVIGFSLWGSVTYLPMYLQVLKGLSPTNSGLHLLSLMAGMLTTSILSGQLISKTGRYRFYPIMGMAIMTAGMVTLSRADLSTSLLFLGFNFFFLGVGMGLVMQVLVLAIQNAVPHPVLGVATSGAILFRFMGGAVGTAVLGAIFSGHLQQKLEGLIEQGILTKDQLSGISPKSIAMLPDEHRMTFINAFSSAFHSVFTVAACVAVIGFIITWLIPEVPLRKTLSPASSPEGSTETAEKML